MKPNLKVLSPSKIDINGSPKVRGELHEEVASEYCAAYKRKVSMPRAVLFEVEQGHFLIADGLHRITAMLTAGTTSATFDVFQGTYQDCLQFALKANLSHGLRRSNADKRAGVIAALSSFRELSNVQIAELSAVGDDLVREVRKELEADNLIPQTDKRTGADGKRYDSKKTGRVRKTNPEAQETPINDVKVKSSVPSAGTPAVPDKEPVVLDQTGYKVPPKALVYWNRRQEIQDILTTISRISSNLERALKEGDKLYQAEIRPTALSDLKMIYTTFTHAMPFAVCPYCQGQLPEKCMTCKGRGVISKLKFDVLPPEFKRVRERAAQKK
jgi:hypothetical protein